MITSRTFIPLAMTALLAACSGPGSPRVETMENGVYIRKNVRTYHISGARDGAATHATALITLDEGDTVQIDMNVTYNPTPALTTAHWMRKGKSAEEGDVHAESLKFLGGQGGTPSVGGRFRLDSSGNPRMRVTLPARPLERPTS
ncbi:MAG TPA: hypothetical protein VN852_05865 [Candidatus Krumholzibacteria bacterium]|nr:hypothetical protein [Candidatus Krumholzibacteria bacterium]